MATNTTAVAKQVRAFCLESMEHTSYFLLLSKQRLNHRTTMLSISNFIGILALLLYFGSLILTLLAFLDKRTGENKNASPARLRHFLTIGLDLLY